MVDINQIESRAKPQERKIDVDYISAYDKTRKKLINNQDENFLYVLDSNYLSYKFKDPVYVTRIVLYAQESLNYIDVKIESAISNKKNTIIGKASDSDNIRIFNVDKYIKSFQFKGKYLSKIHLTNIEIYGFTIDELKLIKNRFNDIDKEIESTNEKIKLAKDEIENREVQLQNDQNKFEEYRNNLNNEINEKEQRRDSLNDEIESLNDEKEKQAEELKNIDSKLNKSQERISELSNREENLNNSIQQRENESKQLNKEISEQKNKLKELESDVSLFTDEIQSYARESRRNIGFYALLSVLSWGVIVFVTYQLFYGAVDLTTVIRDSENIDILNVVISRIPFAIVAVFLIETSFRFSYLFFKRIIDIHNDRMSLSKLSIIARDVSESEAIGLDDLSNQDIYQLRTQLKMQLLRSHLSREFNASFDFQPITREGIIKRFTDLISKKSDTERSEPSSD